MKFRVSAVFSPKETLDFLARNSGSRWEVESVPDEQEIARTALSVAPPTPEAIYKPDRVRTQRKSKVNEAILGSLKAGRGSPADLKQALADAGMSPSSLTTGVQILQKKGTIKRADNGEYYLASIAPIDRAAE